MLDDYGTNAAICYHVVATMKYEPTVTPNNDPKRPNLKWKVRFWDAGKPHKKFFASKDAAESHASTIRGDSITARKRITLLPQSEIEQLLLIHDEAEKTGLSLTTVLSLMSGAKPKSSLSIKDVMAEMELAKRNAGRANDYLKSLKQIVSQFSKGRGKIPISEFSVKDVESFLDSKNIRSRSTLRARLSTLFEFAVRRGYRESNPCNQLEAVTITAEPPSVLTAKETKTALKWLVENPRSLAWFALTTFAGLRPEEAQKTRWADIHVKEGWIRVEAQTTKVRQRRVVYPLPAALAWLKRAKRLKSELPLSPKKQLKDRKALRKILKWPVWKQDVTRHTAASYWLAGDGETVKHVAKMLGHSEAVCESQYKAVKTQKEAAEFWAAVSNCGK